MRVIAVVQFMIIWQVKYYYYLLAYYLMLLTIYLLNYFFTVQVGYFFIIGPSISIKRGIDSVKSLKLILLIIERERLHIKIIDFFVVNRNEVLVGA